MLKKTMTYEGYNGESITEDFYFSLSKAELIEMEMVAEGGSYSDLMANIVAEEDKQKILDTFKDIILRSIGRRSEDGRRFIKNQEIRDEFEQTPAFGDLLVEFYTESDQAALFVAGIVPSDLGDKVKAGLADGTIGEHAGIKDIQLPDGSTDVIKEEPEKTWEDYTRADLLLLEDSEFEKLTKGMTPVQMPRALLAVAMQRKQQNPQ